ncbi:dihydrodipicolinate synthase family protein [Oscillospiraceae bacterium MB08-C2-2]|nr:dihydrodipicolinate synthase family protein [Oscillospiraceae bacterium MB08-C2-2]
MSKNQKHTLRGVVPAIVTPMKEDGEISFSLLEKQAQYLKDVGVHGLFVCGGTGEGAYLSIEEKKEVYKCVRNVVGHDLFICLAAISSNTHSALKEIDAFSDLDPDFLVSTTPYYHGADQNVILEHYRRVIEHSFAPVIVYNIPSATANPIALETILTLSEMDNVAGVKDSSGDFCQFSRGLFGPRKEGFSWIQGEDYLAAPALLCGANGVVTGLSNARAEAFVEMYNASVAGDTATVARCQAKINVLYKIVPVGGFKNGNAGIKAVGELAGRGSRYMRQPGLTLSDEQMRRIAAVMEEYDAL